MYFIYLVRCCDGTLYCGITTDPLRRLQEHNSVSGKRAKYTRGRSPVVLVYLENVKDRSHALQRERQIKQFNRRAKEDLICSEKNTVLPLHLHSREAALKNAAAQDS